MVSLSQERDQKRKGKMLYLGTFNDTSSLFIMKKRLYTFVLT